MPAPVDGKGGGPTTLGSKRVASPTEGRSLVEITWYPCTIPAERGRGVSWHPAKGARHEAAGGRRLGLRRHSNSCGGRGKQT